jgi:vacuolar-type H+-ATPase subunit D/Vma8
MAKKEGDYLDIESFIDEMVSLVEKRLKAQEESIARMSAELKNVKRRVDGLSGKGNVRIDKSLLKVLRQ